MLRRRKAGVAPRDEAKAEVYVDATEAYALRTLLEKRSFFIKIMSAMLIYGVSCLSNYNFFILKSNELVTTLTELRAIAPPAIIGLSSPRAAIGIPIVL